MGTEDSMSEFSMSEFSSDPEEESQVNKTPGKANEADDTDQVGNMVDGTPQTAGDTQATTDDGHEASDRSLQLNLEQRVNDGSGVEYRTRSGRTVKDAEAIQRLRQSLKSKLLKRGIVIILIVS